MNEIWWYVGFVLFWMLIVMPWYRLRMRQGGEGGRPQRKRTTTLKPKPTVNMPAPLGRWWQRRIVRWF